jgi:hypothetical protein
LITRPSQAVRVRPIDDACQIHGGHHDRPRPLRPPEVDRTRALNDALRTSLTGGSIMLTQAVAALGAEAQREILEALKRYDEFDADNDPYGEHDFGAVEIKGTRIVFKIDYYDRDYAFASPDASDENLAPRVMTIMLAEEY